MVDDEKLSEVLSEFARTMITDFPIQRILDRLVDRIVEVLPVTSAGVVLIAEGWAPHYIAVSDDSARRFDRLQTELGEGPCLEAYGTGSAVSVPDLATDERFPQYAAAGVASGLGAVFAFPLCHDNERFGAMGLYCDTPGGLDDADMTAAQTLSDVAAALLLNAKARSEALAASDRFEHNSLHDALTGLPNRILFHERLEHGATRAQRAHTYTAVLFLDLDRFKQINDDHGHDIGDQLLRAVAARLSGLIRGSDTLSRISGDEFAFLCEDLSSVDDVHVLVERIDATFEEPFTLNGVDLAITTSVGLAYVGPGEALTSDLVRRADMDMYRAKHAGTEVVEVPAARLSGDDELELDVRHSLTAREFTIAYQPVVRSSTGNFAGVEALLRWTRPHHGPISPLTIVSIAERSDLIDKIGVWVLEQACTDHARWVAHNPDVVLDLAVNVSARQLMTPNFLATVQAVLQRAGMNARSLILELTESIAMERDIRIADVLTELSSIGVRLALDDFGTGYSALSQLSRLPLSIVKIDRGFIATLERPAVRVIVAAVTAMAHELGLEVVAEGVETHAQHDATVAIGCDFTQGYLHARPMPFDAVVDLIGTSPDRWSATQHAH